MSEQTNVLIIVDTYATVNGNTTVYVVDDNGEASSNELTIHCGIGDIINFYMAPPGCVLSALEPPRRGRGPSSPPAT